jgi:uncharacterized protein YecT (DUF1311 family)
MSSFSKYLSRGVVILALIGAANAKDHPHVADADREYEAVLSHGENPCAKQSTTIGFEQCFGKEVEFTEDHLTAFLDAVRAIVADERGACVGIKPACGVRHLDLLNNADRAWREYKKNLCELEFAEFDGGSGAGSAQSECEYQADRQYVRQVADVILLKTLAK